MSETREFQTSQVRPGWPKKPKKIRKREETSFRGETNFAQFAQGPTTSENTSGSFTPPTVGQLPKLGRGIGRSSPDTSAGSRRGNALPKIGRGTGEAHLSGARKSLELRHSQVGAAGRGRLEGFASGISDTFKNATATLIDIFD